MKYKIWLAVFLFFLMCGSSLQAVEICQDFLETGNPGGWSGSLKTFDDDWTLSQSDSVDVDIWLNDAPETMVTAGFYIVFDPAQVSVVSVEGYESTTNPPGPWDAGFVSSFEVSPGHWFLSVGNFGCVTPDGDGDIILAKATFQCTSSEDAAITISTIPGFDTVVGCSGKLYDSFIAADSITIHQVPYEFLCDDGIDNDEDGLADCADDDCDGTVGSPTVCGLGECAGNAGTLICQDGGQVDTCNPLAGATPEDCSDGLDNDCDGFIDCDDSSCAGPPCDESTVYEDAEDGMTGRWFVYDDTPAGAEIYNVFDTERQSNVIELAGSGVDNGYRLTRDDGSRWYNTTQTVIEWSMKYDEYFVVYVDLETTAGHRYLTYIPEDYTNLGSGEYVEYGLGANTKDGQWRVFVRDLQADLAQSQPGVMILEVNGFLIRGSGRVDDVMLLSEFPVDAPIYEDAEDGLTDRWYVYDDTPAGAEIYNVFDAERQSNVIEFAGSSTDNGYRLTRDDGSRWHNTTQKVLEWRMQFDEYFVVYVDMETTAGHRYLTYTPNNYTNLGGGEYVEYGLGTITRDGQWRVFVRDLQADLSLAQPGVVILEVNGLLIRGSGRVDDVMLLNEFPADVPIYEDAEDGLTDRWYVYDSTPDGAQINNIYDADRLSNVIELSGSGTLNGYRLTKDDGSLWHNTTQTVLEWSMKFDAFFVVYVDIETTAGHRYLQYNPVEFNLLGIGQYVFYGLGSALTDGQWHTVVRDLQADLAGAQPGVVILEVNGLLLRGSGKVDDVKLHSTLP